MNNSLSKTLGALLVLASCAAAQAEELDLGKLRQHPEDDGSVA